jgi:hypothetical protein
LNLSEHVLLVKPWVALPIAMGFWLAELGQDAPIAMINFIEIVEPF